MNYALYETWRKWIFYKRLLIGFFALNVFSVAVSIVLSFSYWEDLLSAPDKVKQLIIVGLLTFVFGLVLPMYLFFKIGSMLNDARKELEEAARQIAREWMKQFEKYDEQAFKNVDFWMNALLLGAEQVGRYYHHPIANLGGELARLVRQEIHKIRPT